jgi:hypothetical protein
MIIKNLEAIIIGITAGFYIHQLLEDYNVNVNYFL